MTTDKVPKDWTRVKFRDIAASITERVDDPSAAGVDRYVGLEHLDPDSTLIRRWGSPSEVESTKLRFYPGDVVYGRRRAYQRKLGVADFEGICSAHALVLRARPEVCVAEFLPYFLQSDAFHHRALDISVGSLSPTINWKTLAVQEFALPPLDEQQKIVEVLAQAESVVVLSFRAVHVARTALIQMSIRLTGPTGLPSVPLERAAEVLDSRRIPVNDAERSKRVGSVPYYGANGQVGVIDTAIFNEPLVLVPEDGGRFSEWCSKPVAYRIDGPSWVNNHAHVLKAKGVPHGWLYFSLRNLDMTHLVVGTTRTKLNRSSLTKIVIAVPEDLARRLELLERVDAVRAVAEKHLEDAKRIFSELRNKLVSLGGHDHVQ
jgi:restriction endonuclease S subunit